jgi:hypothetical protein
MGGRISERHATYISLWTFALAFGWIEGCVVVYLRDLYLHDAAAQGSGIGLQVTTVALPLRTVRLELVREACTIFVLAAVAWMSSRRMSGRWGAFLIGFGIWDLMYYVTLWLVLGWPENLSAWDILFLIPVPWVAPVWAPVVVALVFVAAGSWLFYTEDRARTWRLLDATIILVACAIIVGSFLVESGAAVEHRVPRSYPAWLFWIGVAVGVGWFARTERVSRQIGLRRGVVGHTHAPRAPM